MSSPKAAFRRQPGSGQKTFTVMSLHIDNNYAKKRGIGKKLLHTIRAVLQEEYVDLVAVDFDGAGWRQSSGNNLNRLVFLRKHLPTQTFRRHQATHQSGALVQFLANGPMCVALSTPRTRAMYGRFVYTGPLQFPARSLASVQKIRVATTKYGCTWTSSATAMLTCHEEIMSNVSFSRKGLAPPRLPKRKLGTMMEVTILFHLCRRCENFCFHKQCVRRVEGIVQQGPRSMA